MEEGEGDEAGEVIWSRIGPRRRISYTQLPRFTQDISISIS